MAKRKSIKKSNILFTPYPNYYTWGGDLLEGVKASSGSIGSAIGGLAGGAISGGLESGAGSAISNIGGTIGSAVSKVNPLLGGIVSVGSGFIGGGINRLVGSKLNTEKIAEIEKSNKAMNTVIVDSSNADSVMDQWTNQDFGANFSQADVGKDGLFSNKARRTYNRLKKGQDTARNRALLAYEDAIDAVDTQSDLNVLSHSIAHGGHLNINRNMFNRGGIMHQHGGDFSNGLIFIDNGGTHEQNPFEGVQMGVDAQGIPNLVEEGEVVFNDYVFSNRLTVPNAVREKYKLRGNKELTFADAAKQMQKESEERPNDPISKRGLLSSMSRLQQAQETVRQQNQVGQEGVQYAHGGRMGILYSGTGPYPNSLGEDEYDEDNFVGYTKRGILTDDGNIISSASPDIVSAQSESTTIPRKETGSRSTGSSSSDNKRNLSWLRYAPAEGPAIVAATSLLSKPDYTPSDTTLEAANQVGNYTPIRYTPNGNYLQYDPFDINYYLTKLSAQAGATRRAIMNTSNPSRNAALLAADYNAQGKLGDLARQAEEYNLAQRQAVEQFNRGTNQANSEMELKAAMANQDAALKARSGKLSGITQAMQMRDAIDSRRSASISSNLTNLFNNLGNIGIDAMNRADRDFYIKHVMGANLPLEEYRRLYGIDAAKNEAKKRGFTDNEITKLFSFKNGGKLKKRRGGLTY